MKIFRRLFHVLRERFLDFQGAFTRTKIHCDRSLVSVRRNLIVWYAWIPNLGSPQAKLHCVASEHERFIQITRKHVKGHQKAKESPHIIIVSDVDFMGDFSHLKLKPSLWENGNIFIYWKRHAGSHNTQMPSPKIRNYRSKFDQPIARKSWSVLEYDLNVNFQ